MDNRYCTKDTETGDRANWPPRHESRRDVEREEVGRKKRRVNQSFGGVGEDPGQVTVLPDSAGENALLAQQIERQRNMR